MQKEFGTPIKKLAFVYENGDWSKGFAAQWKKLAQDGGYEVVLDEPYPFTATDLSPVVQKIRRARADVLMLVSNAADAILLTNTLAEYKVNLKAIITSGGGHADPSFMQTVGENARYIFDIVEWETNVNKPGAKQTNDRYKAGYGANLTGEAVDAYLSMYLIKAVLEKAGSLDPAKIRQALVDINLTDGPGMIVGYDAVLHIIVLIYFYAYLTTSWNMVGGFAGVLPLGHAVPILPWRPSPLPRGSGSWSRTSITWVRSRSTARVACRSRPWTRASPISCSPPRCRTTTSS
ncbi:ABC transporter substrate-binding protein [Desulfosarcina ovata]|uniref:Leucine-binding protein domain-containing protein n=1 Tax=Desulfosarcina ovata subsp. ovata TaxID=2752305 RepID=A0A5K8AGE7_9BACT|nr:ABC transporter substrate-binding protein [Desulfosarcina ovata]BBO91717.1 hypothetical protein DSCOOX_48970 [Desulfosarcina ovata subsp. ovata]